MLNRLRPDEERYARRMARIARWDRPIEAAAERLRAWANMLLVDHGIFRLAYLNAHRVTPRLWRAAQPAPGQIAWFARQGVQTIVNLRGGREHGSWPLQREACERHGIALVDFVLRSRGAPERETILGARAFFATLKEPALVHCKSGADRAGFFAALYLLIHEGRPLDEAMQQLSLALRPFPFRQDRHSRLRSSRPIGAKAKPRASPSSTGSRPSTIPPGWSATSSRASSHR